MKILKSIIKESILNELSVLKSVNDDMKTVISESYGISTEVENTVLKIKDEIIKNSKEKNWIQQGKIKIKNGNFKYNIFGELININYNIINFITEENYDELWENFDFGAEYKANIKTISLTIGMFNGGYITSTFISSLQHELTHLYDNIKTNGHTIPDKSKNLYKKIVGLLSSNNKIFSEKVYELGWCLYYSFKSERMAFANSFYTIVKQDVNLINQTEEYNMLYLYKRVLEYWNEYKSCAQAFELTSQKCYNIINNGYKELVRALGRAYTKAKTDIINEGTMIEPRKSKPLKILMP